MAEKTQTAKSQRPDLSMLNGAAIKDVDQVDAYFEKLTGKKMTPAERADWEKTFGQA
jgi:hypothetical protein